MSTSRPHPAAVLALLAAVVVLLITHGPSRDGGGDSVDATYPDGVRGHVIRAVDGDTALIRLPGHVERVRYIGIDTPESVKPGVPVQCYAHKASDRNSQLVAGKEVRLRFDAEHRDPYDRLLAYVFRGRRFVNADLVREGFARTLEIAPNTSHAGLFARLARRASVARRGLWRAC